MHPYKERKEEVRRLIMAEFAGYPGPNMIIPGLPRTRLLDLAFSNRMYPELKMYVGEDCDWDYYQRIEFFEWYFMLTALTPEEVPYVISHLMVSLLNEYEGEPEMLIRFLDVPQYAMMRVNPEMTKKGWPSTLASQMSTRNETKFSLLTGGQIHAVIEWLKLSREWPILEDRLAEVDSAIAYWQQRHQLLEQETDM